MSDDTCLTFFHVDPIQMIKRIKKLPELWNPDDPHYRDKIKRRNAWLSIYRGYFPDFDNMSSNDQEEITGYISKKWRNVKDAYLKDLKYNVSKKGGMATRNKPRKRYKYAKILSFLQPVFASTLNDISLMDESLIDRLNQSHGAESYDDGSDKVDDSESEHEIIPLIPIGPTTPKRRRKIKASDSPLYEFYSVVSPKEESPEPEAPPDSPAESVELNQDKLFFDSLLPMVSDLTDAERLEFRVDLLNMIKNLKSKRSN